MSRIYNPTTDAYYDPNSMLDVYLSEQQVAEALQAITDKSEEGKAVSKLIEVSESLRRHMFEGEVTQSDYSKEIQNMQKQFNLDCCAKIKYTALLTKLCLSNADQKDALAELLAICPDIQEMPRFVRLKLFLYTVVKLFTFKKLRKEISRRKNFMKKIIRLKKEMKR